MTRLLFVLLLLGSTLHAAESTAKPNILFILVDDLGYGDLSCYGGVGVKTANCDRLASEGTRFTQFYVAAPICSPSRVGFTTGMFPSRWRIHSYLHERRGNRGDGQADYLDPKAPSLARTLHEAGYATGHFGKWHMGGGRDVDDAPLPSAYGFDESLVNSTPLEGMGPALPAGTPRWKTTSLFIERTLDFIRRQKAAGRPFYVNLWFSEVHDAHVPRPQDADPELPVTKGGYPQSMDAFRRTLTGFDRDMGTLLAGLHNMDMDDNTLILFTGDNGPNPLYDATTRARSGGLRGQKWSLYEGGIREPFFVRWPGHVPAGKLDETSVLSSVDFFPSVCRIAGVKPPEDAMLDGEEVTQAWFGEPVRRKHPLLWEYGRTRNFLYPKLESDHSPNLAIRDGNWKLLAQDDGSRTELYDLASDPHETSNVAAEHKDIASRLRDAVLEYRHSLPKP